MLELKKEKKRNIIKSKDYRHKATAQQTHSDHNYCAYNINNQSAESVSDNEIIERKKNFSLIKFSNEEFSSIQY